MSQPDEPRQSAGSPEHRAGLRLGERDSVFAWLRQVSSWNVGLVLHLLYEFPFDTIRSDPRCPALLEEVGVR